MGKIAARDMDFTLNAVSIECFLRNFTMNVKPENPVVTTFCDVGPRVVQANYGWDESLDGPADFAAGASDATLFGLLGSQGVAQTLETTGAVATAGSPTFTGTAVLGSYSLKWAVGASADYSATLLGNSALVRNVT